MKSFSIIFSGLSLILVILVVIPLASMILSSDPEILKSTISDQEVVSSILLTLRAALWATLVCTVFGIPLAYLLARWNFPGKSLVQGLVDLPVMIPHTAAGIALLMVYGKNFFMGQAFGKVGLTFVGTEAGISLAMAYVSLPFLSEVRARGPYIRGLSLAGVFSGEHSLSLAPHTLRGHNDVGQGNIRVRGRGRAGISSHDRAHTYMGKVPGLWAQICKTRVRPPYHPVPSYLCCPALVGRTQKGGLIAPSRRYMS